MLFTIQEDLELIKELEISATQLLFIKMLIEDPSLSDTEFRRKCIATSMQLNDLNPITNEELADLISREILINYNKVGSLEIDGFEINNKFKRKFMLKVTPLSTTLFDQYPTMFEAEGKIFNARTASPQEIAPAYMRAINKDVDEHVRILADLKWAVDNNFLRVGLKKFVDTCHWFYIRDLKKKFDKKPLNKIKLG